MHLNYPEAKNTLLRYEINLNRFLNEFGVYGYPIKDLDYTVWHPVVRLTLHSDAGQVVEVVASSDGLPCKFIGVDKAGNRYNLLDSLKEESPDGKWSVEECGMDEEALTRINKTRCVPSFDGLLCRKRDDLGEAVVSLVEAMTDTDMVSENDFDTADFVEEVRDFVEGLLDAKGFAVCDPGYDDEIPCFMYGNCKYHNCPYKDFGFVLNNPESN